MKKIEKKKFARIYPTLLSKKNILHLMMYAYFNYTFTQFSLFPTNPVNVNTLRLWITRSESMCKHFDKFQFRCIHLFTDCHTSKTKFQQKPSKIVSLFKIQIGRRPSHPLPILFELLYFLISSRPLLINATHPPSKHETLN